MTGIVVVLDLRGFAAAAGRPQGAFKLAAAVGHGAVFLVALPLTIPSPLGSAARRCSLRCT